MADQGTQRRRYPRYLAQIDAIIYLSPSPLKVRIVNISRGGCLIYPTLPPLPDPQLRISFRLSEEEPYVNCKGEVVYSIADKGTGVAFTEISIYNQERITEYFEKRLEGANPAGT
jgi:c-di-GMP-binding flagellar brake protein YcgR